MCYAVVTKSKGILGRQIEFIKGENNMCKVVNLTDYKEFCKCCNKETRRYIHMRHKVHLNFCWDCYRDAFIKHNYPKNELELSHVKSNPDYLKPHDKTWSLKWKAMIDELKKDYPTEKGFKVFEQKTHVTRVCDKRSPEGILKWKPKEEEKRFIENLKNNEVKKCFVYIQGCKDNEKNEVYPIVVGKTNVLDPDLSFTDFKESGGNNGTARYLLKCSNLKWHYKSIIVIPCPDEGYIINKSNEKVFQSATTIERDIQMKYRLFGS